MNLPLLYIFASFGFAFVVGYSKISLPVRQWLDRASELHLVGGEDKIEEGEVMGYSKPVRIATRWLLYLFECPACIGFWLGLLATLTPIADMLPMDFPRYVVALWLGFANCGAMLALGVLTKLIRLE